MHINKQTVSFKMLTKGSIDSQITIPPVNLYSERIIHSTFFVFNCFPSKGLNAVLDRIRSSVSSMLPFLRTSRTHLLQFLQLSPITHLP